MDFKYIDKFYIPLNSLEDLSIMCVIFSYVQIYGIPSFYLFEWGLTLLVRTKRDLHIASRHLNFTWRAFHGKSPNALVGFIAEKPHNKQAFVCSGLALIDDAILLNEISVSSNIQQSKKDGEEMEYRIMVEVCAWVGV